MSLDGDLEFIAKEIDKFLDLELEVSSDPESRLVQAMRYSSIGSGKKVRPYMVYASSYMFDVPLEKAIKVGASIEMVHSFSLIHDDLPCMDDDDIRRGKPSLHIKFDESTALLAGNSLLIKAFKILGGKLVHSDPNIRINLISNLADVSGHTGMCGGQMIDLLSTTQDFDRKILQRLNYLKTAALIAFSCESGGILGGASAKKCQVLKRFGFNLGLAFQIVDDILDIEGEERNLGKRVQKDKAIGKRNLVSIYGLKAAKAEAQELIEIANRELFESFGKRSLKLQSLANFILSRNY